MLATRARARATRSPARAFCNVTIVVVECVEMSILLVSCRYRFVYHLLEQSVKTLSVERFDSKTMAVGPIKTALHLIIIS